MAYYTILWIIVVVVYASIGRATCTLSTEMTVEYCPHTFNDWEKAAIAKNCSSNNSSKENPKVYHCVPINNTTILVEVCTKPLLYVDGVCLNYDTVDKSLQRNVNTCLSQPLNKNCTFDKKYNSTSLFEHQICYPLKTTRSSGTTMLHDIGENVCKLLICFSYLWSLQHYFV